MIEKIKTGLSIFLILLLFPYIVVMLSGRYGQNEVAAFLQSEEEKEAEKELQALEQWVLEILPGQMSVSYEVEALKAQTVLIRSNLMFHMQEEGVSLEELSEEQLDAWDMKRYTSVELQEIWGKELFEGYYEKIHRAVEETCGKVLTYRGEYVDLPYHAVSAGWTRDGNLLGNAYFYVKAVECPGDLEADNFLTIQELDLDETPEIVNWDDSGYVTEVVLGETSMAGEEFRALQNLPSSCFTLQEQNGKWMAAVKGLGHGFGLSMHQAQLQAVQGKQYLEILQYFYEGLECISFS